MENGKHVLAAGVSRQLAHLYRSRAARIATNSKSRTKKIEIMARHKISLAMLGLSSTGIRVPLILSLRNRDLARPRPRVTQLVSLLVT
uniref:Uncharacterized protein n=1 Tax=Triticum urartu TaxID=4572 RepID=A0A8R7V5S6_TRIUA